MARELNWTGPRSSEVLSGFETEFFGPVRGPDFWYGILFPPDFGHDSRILSGPILLVEKYRIWEIFQMNRIF